MIVSRRGTANTYFTFQSKEAQAKTENMGPSFLGFAQENLERLGRTFGNSKTGNSCWLASPGIQAVLALDIQDR